MPWILLVLLAAACDTWGTPGCGRATGSGVIIEGCYPVIQSCRIVKSPSGRVEADSVTGYNQPEQESEQDSTKNKAPRCNEWESLRDAD